MKGSTFITLRHGHHNGSRDLSPMGEEQMRAVAQHIKEFNIAGLSIVLVCSTAPRAFQSGRIFVEELGIPAELVIFSGCLWDDNRHHANRNETRKLIEDNLVDNSILIALSHMDLVPMMAHHVAQKFDRRRHFDESEFGQGWIINSEGTNPFPPC